jgi:hypothetical protein
MSARTPFDHALAELLRAWKARDDLRRRDDVDLCERTEVWLALDRARTWVASFDGAGRQAGWPRQRTG